MVRLHNEEGAYYLSIHRRALKRVRFLAKSRLYKHLSLRYPWELAEKISDNIVLAAALGIGLGLIIASRRHEEEKHRWHRIHMYKTHELLNGLREIDR